MSLRACHECGTQVSSDATACPSCGAKPNTSRVGVLGWIVAALFGVIVYNVVSAPNTPPASEPPKLTGAELQAKLDNQRAENTARQKKEAAFQFVVLQVAALRGAMRNPSSFVLEDASGSEDGSLLCITYRAQNGFGGMNREHVTMTKGKWSREAAAWNRHCAGKSLHDWDLVKYALK